LDPLFFFFSCNDIGEGDVAQHGINCILNLAPKGANAATSRTPTGFPLSSVLFTKAFIVQPSAEVGQNLSENNILGLAR
jgi:hypothetical protein